MTSESICFPWMLQKSIAKPSDLKVRRPYSTVFSDRVDLFDYIARQFQQMAPVLQQYGDCDLLQVGREMLEYHRSSGSHVSEN